MSYIAAGRLKCDKCNTQHILSNCDQFLFSGHSKFVLIGVAAVAFSQKEHEKKDVFSEARTSMKELLLVWLCCAPSCSVHLYCLHVALGAHASPIQLQRKEKKETSV